MRKEKRRRWKRGRRRPEWQGLVPAEQAGIIRAGKWAESHAVLASRPGATDDKPDGWQRTVSTLLWERGRRRESEEEWEGAAGGQRGKKRRWTKWKYVNDGWEQILSTGTGETCLRWSYTNMSSRQSCSQGRNSLIGWAKPSQPGYRPLNHRLHICVCCCAFQRSSTWLEKHPNQSSENKNRDIIFLCQSRDNGQTNVNKVGWD